MAIFVNGAFDVVGFIMGFEAGELDDEDVIEGFQRLIDDGTAWSLQGSYGRTAAALIASGDCVPTEGSTVRAQAKPEKVGTHCECGASYVYLEHKNAWGYGCAR